MIKTHDVYFSFCKLIRKYVRSECTLNVILKISLLYYVIITNVFQMYQSRAIFQYIKYLSNPVMIGLSVDMPCQDTAMVINDFVPHRYMYYAYVYK